MRNAFAAVLLPLFLFLFHSSFSQPPVISYAPVVSGLSAPVDIVNAGDGSNRLFIVEQGGLIRQWNGTALTTFLDAGPSGENLILTGGEQGLLSMAFHPGYDGIINRYFFIYYTNLAGDIEITRYETMAGNPNLADPSTDQLILTIPHPGNTNHNGGKLQFGPDGYLYFATGDGGGANDPLNNAQNGSSLLGKMIRIDINATNPPAYPTYAVPADNPYVADPSIDDRIWAMGLRNPFRWSFDRLTGDMWIGDVGQSSQEEISFRPAGSTGGVNYGWRCYEGHMPTPGIAPCDPPDNVFPVFDYDNGSGPAAVTGGYVYRGPDYPNFRGYYMAADVYTGNVYLLWPNGSGGFDSSVQAGLTGFIVGMGEGEDGSLYAVSQGTGTLYEIAATGGSPLPVKLGSFIALKKEDHNLLLWTTLSEQNTARFHIEYSTGGTGFDRVGLVTATRQPDGSNYQFEHITAEKNTVYYRLAMEDDDGSLSYSMIVKLAGSTNKDIRIYPTVVRDGLVHVRTHAGTGSIRVFNSLGSLVYQEKPGGRSGMITVRLPYLLKGLYFISVQTDAGIKTARILIDN